MILLLVTVFLYNASANIQTLYIVIDLLPTKLLDHCLSVMSSGDEHRHGTT